MYIYNKISQQLNWYLYQIPHMNVIICTLTKYPSRREKGNKHNEIVFYLIVTQHNDPIKTTE